MKNRNLSAACERNLLTKSEAQLWAEDETRGAAHFRCRWKAAVISPPGIAMQPADLCFTDVTFFF